MKPLSTTRWNTGSQDWKALHKGFKQSNDQVTLLLCTNQMRDHKLFSLQKQIHKQMHFHWRLFVHTHLWSFIYWSIYLLPLSEKNKHYTTTGNICEINSYIQGWCKMKWIHGLPIFTHWPFLSARFLFAVHL